MKTLVVSSLLTFLLCAPAIADSQPPPAASGALRASFVVSSGKQRPRQYEIATVDTTCASVNNKDSDARIEDDIRMCPSGADRLRVEWWTREGGQEYRSTSSLLVRPGARFEIDGGGAKLTVTLK